MGDERPHSCPTKENTVQENQRMRIEYDDEAIAEEAADTFKMAENMVSNMRLRVLMSTQRVSDLRKQTNDLLSSFSSLEKQMAGVQKLYNKCNVETKRRSEGLDEVIYLNNLISHLERVEKQMVLLPCYVKGGYKYLHDLLKNDTNQTTKGKRLATEGNVETKTEQSEKDVDNESTEVDEGRSSSNETETGK